MRNETGEETSECACVGWEVCEGESGGVGCGVCVKGGGWAHL